jgi:hypothetical protein
MCQILQDWALSTIPAPFTSKTLGAVAAVLHRWSIVEHNHLLFALLLSHRNRHIASHSFILGLYNEVVFPDIAFDARFQRVAGKLVLVQMFPLLRSSGHSSLLCPN